MEFTLEPVMPDTPSVWQDHAPIVQQGNLYKVFLTENIDNPGTYNQLLHLLDNVAPYNEVHFYLNNGGGAVDSAFMIIDAMDKCKAPITGFISGTVASATTIIALACNDLVVAPYTSFMAHNYSHSTGHDSGNKIKAYVDFTDKELKRAFTALYKNFLTEEEIQDITHRDREVWLNDIEVRTRWAAYKTAQDGE
jgi:ATP-dependent protease ClpP protease subunit